MLVTNYDQYFGTMQKDSEEIIVNSKLIKRSNLENESLAL